MSRATRFLFAAVTLLGMVSITRAQPQSPFSTATTVFTFAAPAKVLPEVVDDDGNGNPKGLTAEPNINIRPNQTGELLFTGSTTLDNIYFSSTAVPEPGALTLGILGLIMFARCFPRKH